MFTRIWTCSWSMYITFYKFGKWKQCYASFPVVNIFFRFCMDFRHLEAMSLKFTYNCRWCPWWKTSSREWYRSYFSPKRMGKCAYTGATNKYKRTWMDTVKWCSPDSFELSRLDYSSTDNYGRIITENNFL